MPESKAIMQTAVTKGLPHDDSSTEESSGSHKRNSSAVQNFIESQEIPAKNTKIKTRRVVQNNVDDGKTSMSGAHIQYKQPNKDVYTPKKERKRKSTYKPLHANDNLTGYHFDDSPGTGVIFDGWYRIPVDRLHKSDIQKHIQALKVQGTELNYITRKPPAPIDNYCLTKNWFCVPRHYGVSMFGNNFTLGFPDIPKSPTLHNMLQGTPDESELKQITVSCKLLELFDPVKGGTALLAKPPGTGKTWDALNISSMIGEPAIVIVNTKLLATQWVDSVKKHIPGASVELLTSKNKKNPKHLDFGVVTIQSMTAWMMKSDENSPLSPTNLRNRFSILIMDECHHYSAFTFSRCIHVLMTKYAIGLSGTPDRQDGAEKILEHHIGPISFTMAKPYTSVVNVKVLRPFSKTLLAKHNDLPPVIMLDSDTVKKRSYNNTKTYKASEVDRMATLLELCCHDRRNQMLANTIVDFARNRKVLAVSERVVHLELMARKLHELRPDLPLGVIVSDVNDKERAMLIKNSRVLMGTPNMFSESYNDPEISVLVMMTPMSNLRKLWQLVNRILRAGSGWDEVHIVDMYDQYDKCFYKFNKRNTLYKKHNFKVYFDETDQDTLDISEMFQGDGSQVIIEECNV